MKLDVQLLDTQQPQLTPCVAWTPENELFSCSDDQVVRGWGTAANGAETPTVVAQTEYFATGMAWYPSTAPRSIDVFAMCCSDGTVRLMTKAGREEKRIAAHESGAVICVRWNYDGTLFATGGEDGQVKVWSHSGNSRPTLAATGRPAYALAWSPDSQALLIPIGKDIMIKSLKTGQKPLRWSAHEGVILCCDWNAVNGLIVTGGEDRCYRVWDAFGRQLFASAPCEHVVTAVAWNPKGHSFAVGGFDMLRLCDRTGWTYFRDRPGAGSLLSLAWTKDGTSLAAGCGDGSVCLAELLGLRCEWNGVVATLVEPRRVAVADVRSDQLDEYLDFPRDRVVMMEIGFEHLVCATPTQCFVYRVGAWNTPQVLDLRAPPTLLLLSERGFLLADSGQGAQGLAVYNYEGRVLSNPRFSGLQAELLNASRASLAPESLAVVDGGDPCLVRLFDATSGKPLHTGNVRHSAPVEEVALSQFAKGVEGRMVAFVDANRDLWLALLGGARRRAAKGADMAAEGAGRAVKLHTQVDSVAWADDSDALCAVADGRLVAWVYPMAAFVDRDLLPRAMATRPTAELGKMPRIAAFSGARVAVRRADGATLQLPAPTGAALLYEYAEGGRWEEAVRLCRLLKDEAMWAALAGMAVRARQLDTAEIALAAINEVDKLQYILYIKDVPSEEGRNAEMALFMRRPEEAEAILLQASPPLLYRAIKLNVRLFRWDRALELALRHKSHVDTVLGYRKRFLDKFGGREETNPRFLQYAADVEVDWEAIRAKKQKEKEDERLRGDGGDGGRRAYK